VNGLPKFAILMGNIFKKVLHQVPNRLLVVQVILTAFIAELALKPFAAIKAMG